MDGDVGLSQEDRLEPLIEAVLDQDAFEGFPTWSRGYSEEKATAALQVLGLLLGIS